jgi:hypothetical protein
MLRVVAASLATVTLAMAGCSHSGFAVRPVPRIAKESVGKPISRLQDAFGTPRKIDTAPTKLIYVWFLEQIPAGAPAGFHGCELEVTVDPRSDHILGYSLPGLLAVQHRLDQVLGDRAQSSPRGRLTLGSRLSGATCLTIPV